MLHAAFCGSEKAIRYAEHETTPIDRFSTELQDALMTHD